MCFRQAATGRRIDHREQRGRHRLELQGDVRRRADEDDQRSDRSDGLRLAVARGDEVGDRRHILRPGEPGDAPHQRGAEADDQDGPDVNRQKIEAVLGGQADRAVISPGGAIDRETERIDKRTRSARHEAPSSAVAPPGDEEQQRDIGDRGEKDRRAVHRAARSSLRIFRDITGESSGLTIGDGP